MPLFNYTCTDGHKFEELVRDRDAATISCVIDGCTCIANRSTVYAVKTIGPVFEHLEAYNNSLLSKRQRKAGMELRSAKDIRKMEESLGLRRVDPNGSHGRSLLEQQMDDHRDISKVKECDGHIAAVDHVAKTELTNQTGWTDAKYRNWKSTHDAAIATAESGGVDLSSTKRGATPKSPVGRT